jgi:lipopolysaccharide transport system ATP-binding protein
MPSESAITIRDAYKTFRLYDNPIGQTLDALGIYKLFKPKVEPREFHALRGISLDISRGTRMGVVGRNGAGKTTLLKLLTGALQPTSGTVEVNGNIVALLEIGIGFHPDFTGYENIRSSISYNGLADDEVEAAIAEIVDFCELGPFLNQPLKTYSLGMKSRLYFACATAVKPDILIIDEVLGAGDSYFALRSEERMRRLTQSGCTLLLVSHAIDQVLRFCEEAIWIEGGQIVKRGTALEIIKDYEQFIRVLDEKHKQHAMAGGVTAIENEWMRQHLIESVLEKSTRSAKGAKRKKKANIPEEAQLSDGGLSRWPGKTGVKIQNVAITGADGAQPPFHTGQALDVRLDLVHEVEREMTCRYSVIIYTPDARIVSRFHSPEHTFLATPNGEHSVSLRLEPLLLSNGEFLVTIGVYGGGPLDDVGQADRYDNLSLSYKFRVIDRIRSESAAFHHPARWEFAGPGKPQSIEVPWGAP